MPHPADPPPPITHGLVGAAVDHARRLVAEAEARMDQRIIDAVNTAIEPLESKIRRLQAHIVQLFDILDAQRE